MSFIANRHACGERLRIETLIWRNLPRHDDFLEIYVSKSFEEISLQSLSRCGITALLDYMYLTASFLLANCSCQPELMF